MVAFDVFLLRHDINLEEIICLISEKLNSERGSEDL